MKALHAIVCACIIVCTSPLVAQLAVKSASVIKQDVALFTQDVPEKPLSIGDRVPDIAFSMVNYKSAVARLSDFKKSKLVLLDFWATWCGTCIGSFPKLDALQDQFGDQLQVILVNSEGSGDTEKKIADFIKKREAAEGNSFPFVTTAEDHVASRLFPHEYIPHYVWIADGVVKAITSSGDITAENIRKILAGEAIQVAVKRDFFPDRISGFGEDIVIDNELAHFTFFKKGKMEGWKSVNELRKIENNGNSITRGILMRNLSLLEMYKTAIRFKKEYALLDRDPKRMILDMKDVSDLDFTMATATDKEAWEKENLYSYDIVVPATQSSELYERILEDLNRYSGLYGRVEKRKTKCWLLVPLPGKPLPEATNKGFSSVVDGEKHTIKNSPTNLLVRFINLHTAIEWPVIDQLEQNNPFRVNIILDRNTSGVQELKKELNRQGLDLVSAELPLEMLIISPKKTTKDIAARKKENDNTPY